MTIPLFCQPYCSSDDPLGPGPGHYPERCCPVSTYLFDAGIESFCILAHDHDIKPVAFYRPHVRIQIECFSQSQYYALVILHGRGCDRPEQDRFCSLQFCNIPICTGTSGLFPAVVSYVHREILILRVQQIQDVFCYRDHFMTDSVSLNNCNPGHFDFHCMTSSFTARAISEGVAPQCTTAPDLPLNNPIPTRSERQQRAINGSS